MFIELGIIGGIAAAWFGRNTKPVKIVTSPIKRWWSRTRFGKSVILANAKDGIKNEFINEKEKLNNNILEANIDQKTLNKKEEYIEFLNYAINSDQCTDEEKLEYSKDLEVKETELKILRESLNQKLSLIEGKQKALDAYESNVLDKRLSDAQLAEVLFKQEGIIGELQKDLDKINNLGDSTMTNNIVSSYIGNTTDSGIKVARRYELMDKFKKEKDD